ncbi:GTP-binding protein [Streptococcus agalactiae H36B]|nr:GTP-binding protein [Streptococcus agalactiae H36B]
MRHYNEITDVHITDDEFLKLLHELESDALVGMSLIFLISMVNYSWSYRSWQETMFF